MELQQKQLSKYCSSLFTMFAEYHFSGTLQEYRTYDLTQPSGECHSINPSIHLEVEPNPSCPLVLGLTLTSKFDSLKLSPL